MCSFVSWYFLSKHLVKFCKYQKVLFSLCYYFLLLFQCCQYIYIYTRLLNCNSFYFNYFFQRHFTPRTKRRNLIAFNWLLFIEIFFRWLRTIITRELKFTKGIITIEYLNNYNVEEAFFLNLNAIIGYFFCIHSFFKKMQRPSRSKVRGRGRM